MNILIFNYKVKLWTLSDSKLSVHTLLSDFVMATQYIGQQWSRDHMAQLVSPSFIIDQSLCLSFLIYTRSGFQVIYLMPLNLIWYVHFSSTASYGYKFM